MSEDAKLKREEREYWERVALKAIEFVYIKKNGEPFTARESTRRAAEIATGLVQERRDAFNELDIWDDNEPEQQPTAKAEAAQAAAERQEQSDRASNAASAPDDLVTRLARHLDPHDPNSAMGIAREAVKLIAAEGTENAPAQHAPGPTGRVLDFGGPFECSGNGACEVELTKTAPAQHEFDDGLVKRLAKSAWEWSPNYNGTTPFEYINDAARSNMRRSVERILSELATMPVELPTSEPIDFVLSNQPGPAGKVVAEFLRTHLGPILAAKDAERDELKRMLSATIGMRDTYEAELKAARAITPANEVQNAERQQYETTIEQQRARIEELERWKENNKRFTDEWHEAVDALNELWPRDEPIEDNPPQGNWIRRVVAVREKRAIAELEKRLAEQNAPMNAEGKTPGQVGYEVWYPLCRHGMSMVRRDWHTDVAARDREIWETTAQSILRAFGNGADALRRARERIANATPDGRFDTSAGEFPALVVDNVTAILDDELAKLGGQTDVRSDEYYLLSLDHSLRNDWLLWWRPNAQGYTTNLLEAGTYSKTDAESKQRSAPEKVKALPIALVKQRAKDSSFVATSHLHELREMVTE